MKKLIIKFGLLGSLFFIFAFIYHFKTSFKFRQSVIAAFVAASLFFSGIKPANAEGFTNPNPPSNSRSRSQSKQGIFGGNSRNSGSGAENPNNFDNKAVRKMPYSDKLKYLRTTVPDEKVFELQNEIGKMLLEPENISVPGFLGKNKIEGIIDIDLSSRIVSFTTAGTDKHRTIVKMSPEQMKKLVKRDFHLYPEK